MTSDATSDIDALVGEIHSLSNRIDGLPEDDPTRRALIDERTALRGRAADMRDELRHPVSVLAEIAMLEDRLDAIDALKISEGYNEKYLNHTVQDPGAYSHAINRLLDEQHAAEIDEITHRLTHLRTLVPDPTDG